MPISMRLILLITFWLVQLVRCANLASLAPGGSKWSLDPFLGTYDMDSSKAINMVEFSHGLLGVAEQVARAGERQTFAKTTNGSKYTQTVSRPGLHDPSKDHTYVFALGEEIAIHQPGGITSTVTFSMASATILLARYVYNTGKQTVVFNVYFDFYSDGSGFFDSVKVLQPVDLTATAPFLRTDLRFSKPAADNIVPVSTSQCVLGDKWDYIQVVLEPGDQLVLPMMLSPFTTSTGDPEVRKDCVQFRLQ